MPQVTKKEVAIVREIYANGGKLAKDLKAKCNWEKMSPVAVLHDWPSFVRRHKAAQSRKATQEKKTANLERWIQLAKIRTPSRKQFLEAVSLCKATGVRQALDGGGLRRPDWIPHYWGREWIKGSKKTFTDFVAETLDDECWICKKPLGFMNRFDHSPREHTHCHNAVSESCLG